MISKEVLTKGYLNIGTGTQGLFEWNQVARKGRWLP